jgi:hypothetical protein
MHEVVALAEDWFVLFAGGDANQPAVVDSRAARVWAWWAMRTPEAMMSAPPTRTEGLGVLRQTSQETKVPVSSWV